MTEETLEAPQETQGESTFDDLMAIAEGGGSTEEAESSVYDDLMSIADSSDGEEVVAEKKEESPEAKEEGATEEEKKDSEEKKTELSAEQKEAKAEELVKKSETEDLSDEEIEFLKGEGYDVEVKEPEAKEDVQKEEEPPKVEDHSTPFDDFLSKAYPGETFETPDQKQARVLEHIEKDRKANEALVNIFEESPEVSSLVNYFMDNPNATMAQAVHEIGIDLAAAPEPGQDGYKEYIIAQERAKTQKLEAKKAQKELQENYQKSAEVSKSFIQENKMSEDEGKEYFKSIDSIITNFTKGVMPKDFLDMYKKALAYDRDVAAAEAKGEVKGRNQTIKITKKAKKGDPVPVLNGGESIQDSKVSDEMKLIQGNTRTEDDW